MRMHMVEHPKFTDWPLAGSPQSKARAHEHPVLRITLLDRDGHQQVSTLSSTLPMQHTALTPGDQAHIHRLCREFYGIYGAKVLGVEVLTHQDWEVG